MLGGRTRRIVFSCAQSATCSEAPRQSRSAATALSESGADGRITAFTVIRYLELSRERGFAPPRATSRNSFTHERLAVVAWPASPK